jgi:hypothetical protein
MVQGIVRERGIEVERARERQRLAELRWRFYESLLLLG